MYAMSQMPSQDELAKQAKASRQVTADAAQVGIDALLAMTLPDLKGVPQSLGQWNGRIRVINYWATWCPPLCRGNADFLASAGAFCRSGRAVRRYRHGRDREDAGVRAENASELPLLVGGTNPNGNPAFTLRGMPHTVVVDRDGKVAFSMYGGLKESDWNRYCAV